MNVAENAADGCLVFVPMEETWPDWHCDWCSQRMSGHEFACGYCGNVRDDIDGLAR